jgi:hypothetical protein
MAKEIEKARVNFQLMICQAFQYMAIDFINYKPGRRRDPNITSTNPIEALRDPQLKSLDATRTMSSFRGYSHMPRTHSEAFPPTMQLHGDFYCRRHADVYTVRDESLHTLVKTGIHNS